LSSSESLSTESRPADTPKSILRYIVDGMLPDDPMDVLRQPLSWQQLIYLLLKMVQTVLMVQAAVVAFLSALGH